MTRQEQEIRRVLIEKMDEIFDHPSVEDLKCWHGENIAERMADAALSVLMAQKEVQDFMKKEGVTV